MILKDINDEFSIYRLGDTIIIADTKTVFGFKSFCNAIKALNQYNKIKYVLSRV
jgi:hypothetical protein